MARAQHPHELAYDQLVIALGSVSNFFGLPGVEERALTMKSLNDAVYLAQPAYRAVGRSRF